jgi:hypothetical protein
MGDHYVPQYYLKGFSAAKEELLWVYDKLDRRKFRTQVKNIANENRFYSPAIERYLANVIEGPANSVLKAIREKNLLTDDDKRLLAEYMAVMWKRVPQGKQLFRDTAPAVAQKLSARYDSDLDTVASSEPDKAAFVVKRRAEIGEIIKKYSEDPPKDIWLDIIPPERSPHVVAAIKTMTWTFLTFEEEPAFLTCDNPLFYFRSIGVGNPDSEISFPISCHVTLLATWRSDLCQDYMPVTQQIVKEINRRTASNASRYVYSGYDKDGILPFVLKGRWMLHKIP